MYAYGGEFNTNVTIETKMDEFFSDSDEPVSLNMNVVKLGIANTPVKRLMNKVGIVIAKARFACGVPRTMINPHVNELLPMSFRWNIQYVQKSLKLSVE